MKIFIPLFILFFAACSAPPENVSGSETIIDVPIIDEPDPGAPAHELVACGDDKIIIIDEYASNGADVKIVWSWQASDAAAQLPEVYQRRLATMDECKLVDDGKNILATSSSGAVVLIERATRQCLFYAYVPAAHSAAALPNGRIAVALSEHANGNSIEIYDRRQSEKILFKTDFYSGHAVAWNENRQRLYALGLDELREYSLVNWNTSSPGLALERKWTIPGIGGHDLYMVSDDELLFTVTVGVYLFNISTEKFAQFEPLKNAIAIKSVNYIRESQKLVYTQAEESWWTFRISLKNPDKSILIPNIKLYKVRLSY